MRRGQKKQEQEPAVAADSVEEAEVVGADAVLEAAGSAVATKKD
jgi:hypothetical protein